MHLLSEVAKLNPIQDDRNENVVWWCAFCGAEARNEQVTHKADCLWVRIREHVAASPCRSLFPATKIGHWPHQDVPCCDRHAEKMQSVADAIGLCISFSPAPCSVECVNCKYEAKARSK